MDTPSSPPSTPPELVDHGERLWTSLFPKALHPSAPPPPAPPRPPAAAPPRGWFQRAQVRFFEALPAYFEHLGAVIPGLVVAVLTGVLLGYLLGVVRDGADQASASTRATVVNDRHERELVRLHAASAQESRGLEPVRGELHAARAELAELRDLTILYEGLRTAQRALQSLEARQFGEGEATLREATRQLAHLSGKVEGLVPILQRLQRAQLASALDLNVKRRTLMATLAQLDELIGARRAALEAKADAPAEAPPSL